MEDAPAPEPAAEAEPAAEQAAPLIEHIAFRILKSRWSATGLLYAERGLVLLLRTNDGEETLIPLDRDGNILVEKPRPETGFRRLALERFREYEEAGFAMERLLRDAEALGAYSQTRPERIPLILHDYAAGLREELLEAPEQAGLDAWIAARTEYFNSLEELLYGPAEMALVNGYEEIIATETLKDEGLAKLQTLRDELIRVFVAMREQHRRLLAVRGLLAETLAASLCIMGPAAGETGAAESAAILANALLTGCHIIPGQSRYVLFWSLAAACVMLVCIHALRPLAGMIAGLAAALLAAVGFGWSFIISGYWIDPLIPVVSILAGAALIVTVKIACLRYAARRFRLAYGPAVSKPCLQELVRTGRPLLADINTVEAAVVAVKALMPQGQQDPVEAARAAAEFRNTVAAAFKQAGAVITSYECDTVLACFGSPPERICMERNNPEGGPACAERAAGFITELLGTAPRPWYFGIDFGECAFSWSAETGYTANGRQVIRARMLASLAPRCHTQVVITGAVRAQTALPVRKLNQRIPGEPGQDGDLYELCVLNEGPPPLKPLAQ